MISDQGLLPVHATMRIKQVVLLCSVFHLIQATCKDQ